MNTLLNGLLSGAGRLLAQSDDFIPAPATPPPAPPGPGLPAALPKIPVEVTHVGLDTTKLIIGVAIVLVLAALLFFVRNGIKNALVNNRASLDSANFASWSWFLYLLLFLTLIVFGLIGGFFGLLVYSLATGAVGVAGLIACLVISAGARSTRK